MSRQSRVQQGRAEMEDLLEEVARVSADDVAVSGAAPQDIHKLPGPWFLSGLTSGQT
jgi:hypothetical protein